MEKGEGKLINLRPLVISALSLACGIFVAFKSYLIGYFISLILFVLISICFFVLSFLKNKTLKKSILIYLCIITAFLSIGHLTTFGAVSRAKSQPFHNQTETVTARVYEVTYYENGAFVRFDNCNFRGYDLKGRAQAFIPTADLIDKISVGAVAKFTATVYNQALSNPSEPTVYAGVFYEFKNITNVQIIDFKADFYEIGYITTRQFLKKNLSPESYSIALAITLGDTSEIPALKLANYRFAGIAHIFAVSGLHIGLFISVFAFIASKLKLNAKLRPLIILLPALIYCGICGFRPSSLRAFIMASVTLLATLVGFKKDNLSSIALAGIILLVINPFNLFDVGFKLSFLAVTSIFTIYPIFVKGSTKNRVLKPIGNALSLSLSAQLGTLPVLTDMSGYISIISIFTNLIFIPVASFLYVITILFLILSALVCVFYSGGGIIMSVPDLLIKSCDFLISKFNFALLTIPATFSFFRIPWYIGLGCLSQTVNITAKQKIILIVLTLFCVIGGIALTA